MTSARIIDGKQVAARVRAEVAEGVRAFEAQHGRPPGLTTILVGEDPASQTYIRGKQKACAEVGIRSHHLDLPDSTTEAELLDEIARAGDDDTVDGILTQLPVPAHMNTRAVINAIPPDKDVDGFHPVNLGNLVAGQVALPQCTPWGVMRLLDEYDVPLQGVDVTIVGRSNIVGKPLAFMLQQRDATVTMCHSRTRDLAAHTRRADVVVMAVGRADLLTADMVKPGATVIDVGMNRDERGLRGDVDFEGVSAVAGLITPVPGGVGPMTIAMLLSNTLEAARRRVEATAPA